MVERSRLGVVDEIFMRRHRGFGMPIAVQGVWRTDSEVSAAEFHDLHEQFRVSTLGRRVQRARIWGARPRWIASTQAYPLRYRERPIPAARLLDWADAQAVDLNPERGPGWRMTAARVDDGGTIASLVCSHAVADGLGFIRALSDSLDSRAADPLGRGDSDLVDAVSQWATVVRGSFRALPTLLRSGAPPSPTVAARRVRDPVPTSAVISLPAGDFDSVARDTDGSANSLFLTLTAKILRAAGWRGAASVAVPVTVGPLPNDLVTGQFSLSPTDTPNTIKIRSEAAFATAAQQHPPLPAEVLGLLPDRIAHRLTRGVGEADLLCSNLGDLPVSFSQWRGHQTTEVAARAVHPALTAAQLSHSSTRLESYLVRHDDRYYLSLVGLDSDLFATSDRLIATALTACTDQGLPAASSALRS